MRDNEKYGEKCKMLVIMTIRIAVSNEKLCKSYQRSMRDSLAKINNK